MGNDCHLITCRYNNDGKCTNNEKREECTEVSRKVLCLDGWWKQLDNKEIYITEHDKP